jgi:kinetochore protein Nuf2
MESSLRDLNATLNTEKTSLESLERRIRALDTSTESFTACSTDVSATVRVLSDLGADLAREEEELTQATRCRETLSDKTNTVQDIERTERLMKKQLEAVQARTGKLRAQADDRGVAAAKKMEELKSLHGKLAKERGEKAREIERRRVNIEQTEKKVRNDSFSYRFTDFQPILLLQ